MLLSLSLSPSYSRTFPSSLFVLTFPTLRRLPLSPALFRIFRFNLSLTPTAPPIPPLCAHGAVTRSIAPSASYEKMVAVRAKVGSRSYVRQKQLAKGKKVFKIDCSIPAADGIFSEDVLGNFEQFFQDSTKLNGRKGKLSDKVRMSMNDNVLTITTTMAYRKKYFKYLTKKFLKKKDLRDWIRILSTGKGTYQLKYFNIQDQEE
ncbi:hypothetical protein CUR178_00476 [Leishmania enriettii]|uniref:Large ribosomal subunit protein eL22 n=1 Tax=Leishmania enriettii TaxID=5663 RepID=A0A836GX15_LEIEN|nr:hypothetical protein CUR178_00476 [Leishmania enriettii]